MQYANLKKQIHKARYFLILFIYSIQKKKSKLHKEKCQWIPLTGVWDRGLSTKETFQVNETGNYMSYNLFSPLEKWFSY